jgi:hypothetical protein
VPHDETDLRRHRPAAPDVDTSDEQNSHVGQPLRHCDATATAEEWPTVL